MKKNLFTAAFACMAVLPAAQSQVTITDADMPVLGDTVRLSVTGDNWSINPAATGAGFNWDFSFFTPESQDFDTCKDVAALPAPYQFYFNNVILYPAHKANFALRGQDFDLAGMLTMTDVHDFYKKSSTKYQNVGFGANINGIPASVRKNPIETMYSLPMNYGDMYSNYSEFEVEIPTIGTYKQKKQKYAEVDGWGMLTLPIGSFPVLRIKFSVNITDSVYIDAVGFGFETPRPTEMEYHWVGQSRDFPLLQINADSATGTITRIAYQDIYQPIAGVEEAGQSFSFSVYPNPVSQAFTVMSAGPVKELGIYDLYGRKIYTAQPVSAAFTVNIPASLANGAYVVECTGANGVQRQKLVVQR